MSSILFSSYWSVAFILKEPLSIPFEFRFLCREFCRLKTDLSTVGKSRHVKLQNLVALGILDAYRREQAMADAQKASASNAGADEETCPAECVRDIYSGALPGALHGLSLNMCMKRSFFHWS
jgi:hypothetical protein